MMGQPKLPNGTEPKKRTTELGRAFRTFAISSMGRSPASFVRSVSNELVQRAGTINEIIHQDEISEEPKEDFRRGAELKLIAQDAAHMQAAAAYLDFAFQELMKCTGASYNRTDE
jgi:hypothetical protein